MSLPTALQQSQRISADSEKPESSSVNSQHAHALVSSQCDINSQGDTNLHSPPETNNSTPRTLPSCTKDISSHSSSVKENASGGASGTQSQQSDEKEALGLSHAPKVVPPPLGCRIEVLWRIDYDLEEAEKMEVDAGTEASRTVTRWWGATVQDCLKESVGQRCPQHADKKVHILLYDAFQEFGEDTSTVAFISDDSLVDLSQLDDVNKGELQWRLENAKDKQAGANTEDKPQLVSLEQYAAEVSAAVEGAGLSEEADLQILSTLPPHVQAQVASGYRRFADHVKTSLASFLQEKPKDYIVTEADVQRMFATMHPKPTKHV
ncbi:unnamed protein product [Agarophyton chilense]